MKKRLKRFLKRITFFSADLVLFYLELILLPLSLLLFLFVIPIKRAIKIYNSLDNVVECRKFKRNRKIRQKLIKQQISS